LENYTGVQVEARIETDRDSGVSVWALVCFGQ